MVKRSDAPLPQRPHRLGRLRLGGAHILLPIGATAFVLLALVMGEGVSRWWAPDYLVRTRGLHVFSSAYGWTGRPGASAPMGEGRVSLNARGYRGRELLTPKPRGRTRVLVLGDSVAFGYGVSDEQAFPHLLDVRNNGLEAANLAVEGYGPGQELLLLLHEGLSQDPDLVLLAFCLRNDFVDATLPVALYDGITPRPVHRLLGSDLVVDRSAVRLSRPARAVRWLADYSHLFNRLSRLRPGRAVPPDPDWRRRKQQALGDPEAVLRLSVALVSEMSNACARRNVAFLVATFPNGLSYEMPPGLPERFHEALRATGVWLVDMGDRFRARGLTPGALALDRTGHLGPLGHAVSCEILEGEIRSRLRAASARSALARRSPGPVSLKRPQRRSRSSQTSSPWAFSSTSI